MPVDEDRARELATSLYRDEMRRAMTWRVRLDRTTNWSVVLVATLLTWAFSGTGSRPHFVLVVAIGMVTTFLLIEARRYRFYDVFRARLRLLEANAFAPVFEENGGNGEDWKCLLAADFRQPALKMPWLEAVRRRLRRVYGALFLALGVAWCLRMSTMVPEQGFPAAARIDALPGSFVVAGLAAFYLVVLALVLAPLPREARGGLREEEEAAEGWASGE